MKRMRMETLYRKPNTSKPEPDHKVYPYLLRNVPVTGPNQVWAMDVTYIPMARGFVYLTSGVGPFSPPRLARRRSTTIVAGVCLQAPEEAPARYGQPGRVYTGSGSQL